jgi:hypothetical protein
MAFSDRNPIDVWRDAYQRLWHDLEDEGRSPRHVISGWADIKPSTAGAWKRGDCTPQWAKILRLSRAACAEDYTHLSTLFVDETHMIAKRERAAIVTGTLHDNIRDLDQVESVLWEVQETGDVEQGRKAVRELREELTELEAELDRMESKTTCPNGQAA